MTIQELNEIKEALEIGQIRGQLTQLQKEVYKLHKRFNNFWYKILTVVMLPIAVAVIINLVL